MRNFVSFSEWTQAELLKLIEQAQALKAGKAPEAIVGKQLALLFFNQSLRTRVSFESAMFRGGGKAFVLSPGNDTWGFEVEKNVIMSADKAEHIQEAAAVLSRYVDAIGVRSFAKMDSLEEDSKDEIIRAFAEYADVPLINLESAMEHPCQALADMLTLKENVPNYQGKEFVLTWTPHVKPLPLAVPHSALLAASMMGMNVTLASPEGYGIEPKMEAYVRRTCEAAGGSFQKTQEQSDACGQADVVYAKSWGAPALYGNLEEQISQFETLRDWCVRKEHLRQEAIFLHCLPVRRNVVVSDEVLDGSQSRVIGQAENRLWAQMAILEKVFEEGK